jgi:hypothetical protein
MIDVYPVEDEIAGLSLASILRDDTLQLRLCETQ